MTLRPSTLTLAARGLRQHIGDHTDIDDSNVLIGHPAYVEPMENQQAISVYFYRVYQTGNPVAVHPKGMPINTIANCLFTALGEHMNADTGSEDDITSGENDLSILGQVIQCMHKNPILQVVDAEKSEICKVEITPLELSVDEFNKIVPTAPAKGGFRPSVAYALALLPLPYEKEAIDETPVQIVSWGVNADLDHAGPFPQRVFNAITARPGKAIPAGDTERPHIDLKTSSDEYNYFTRIITTDSTTKVVLRIQLPSAGIQNRDELRLSQHYWVADKVDYIQVKEQTAEYSEILDDDWQVPTGDWVVEKIADLYVFHITWELDALAIGQHLFRVALERPVDTDWVRNGNICMVVLAPGSASA